MLQFEKEVVILQKINNINEKYRESLQSIIDVNDTLCREELSQLTLRQKELLFAIAEEGVASKLTFSAFIKRHRLYSASSVQAVMKKLKDDDVIVEEKGLFRVGDRIFGIWLKMMTGTTINEIL